MSTAAASEGDARRGGGPGRAITLCGISLVVDAAGALYWPEEGVLAVADLHLEKGSSFAARGILLPPFDTATTLAALGRLVARYRPRAVIALGDSFHDEGGADRLMTQDRTTLAALQRGRDWVWIAGNHDPTPSRSVGGHFAETLPLGPLMFRHRPTGGPGEIAGHLHPIARVVRRGRMVSRRCFATDRRRLVMPAFGAYAGGLNIHDDAFADVLDRAAATAYMLGDGRVFAIAAGRCRAD